MEMVKYTLEAERLQHKKNIDDLELRWIGERNLLEKDFDARVLASKLDADAAIEDRLSKNTKKTRLMNAAIKNELHYQSKQADMVLEVNQQVLDRDRAMRLELQLAQSAEKEMIGKLSMYQRIIKQLNERVALDVSATDSLKEVFTMEIKTKVLVLLLLFVYFSYIV